MERIYVMDRIREAFYIWWKKQTVTENDAPTYEETFQAGYQARDAEVAELVSDINGLCEDVSRCEEALVLISESISAVDIAQDTLEEIRSKQYNFAKHKQEG